MTDDEPEGLLARIGSGIARFAQWVVFGFVSLLVVIYLGDLTKLGVPGVPVNLVYGTIACLIVIAVVHFPPAFWRLPQIGRPLAYVALVAGSYFANSTGTAVRTAYEKTPEGKAELVAEAKRDAATRAMDAKRDAAAKAIAAKEEAAARKKDEMLAGLAEAEDLQRQLTEINAKLEGCLNWRGRLPALEDPVREAMHNPSSFEHVRTVIIVPGDDRRNVAMVFRAENGFGALRTATVKAQLVPDSCAVQDIGEPEAD